ncbi:hypothetical protein TNCT_92691 [Trichonephila clavata]|uniref:Uncharacterized protein n=1 Tax=Trichonephila clavata TaxID=2740835 RepID=A0A8X6LP90_TRICU|nr:hypothetical protein TNCT_92691 [Trichonephila clavata]
MHLKVITNLPLSAIIRKQVITPNFCCHNRYRGSVLIKQTQEREGQSLLTPSVLHAWYTMIYLNGHLNTNQSLNGFQQMPKATDKSGSTRKNARHL